MVLGRHGQPASKQLGILTVAPHPQQQTRARLEKIKAELQD